MSNTKSYAETQQITKSASNTPHGKIRQKRRRGKNGKGGKPRPIRTPTPTKGPRSKNNSPSYLTPTPIKRATSYAARIASSRSATTTSVKVRSVTSKSPSSASLQSTPRTPNQSQHGNLSKEELLNVRMYQRDICYVAGLPLSLCTRAILGTKKWFGQFGRIREITITDNQNCVRTNWMCAHVKYFEKEAAIKAVQAMNGKVLPEGRVLEANYGTQRYCEHFIYRTKCPKTRCPFRHSWCALSEVMHLHREKETRESHSVSPKKSRRQSQAVHTPQSARDYRSPRKLPRTPSGGNQLPVQSPQMFTSRSDPSPTKSRVTPQRVSCTPKQLKVTPERSMVSPVTPSSNDCNVPTKEHLATTEILDTMVTPQRDTNAVPFDSPQEVQEMVTPQQQQEQQGHDQHRQRSISPQAPDLEQEHETDVMDTTNSPSSISTVSTMPLSTKTQSVASSPSTDSNHSIKAPVFMVEKDSNGTHDTHDSNECGDNGIGGIEEELRRNDGEEYNHSHSQPPRALDTDLALCYASASSGVSSEHVVMSTNSELFMQQRIDAMEMTMKKQQEIVAAYKHKYQRMKGAWSNEKAQVAELTKITRCLMEERKTMCTERERMTAEHDKMAMRYSSMQQQNQALNATVANLQKEMKRLASYIHGHSTTNTNTNAMHSGQAGHSSMSTGGGTPSPYPPSSIPSSHQHQSLHAVRNLDVYSSHRLSAQYVHHQRRQQQQQHQHLASQMNIETEAQIDYNLWQWCDVYRWLMNIANGRLRRYAATLQLSLNQQRVDGSRLKSLDIQDLHRLGIAEFKDREITLQHISGLQSHLGLESILDGLHI